MKYSVKDFLKRVLFSRVPVNSPEELELPYSCRGLRGEFPSTEGPRSRETTERPFERNGPEILRHELNL